MRLPIYIAGPTASGKSALALELAERIGGEIISVDSMQVYKGLDIGTAKPDAAERRRVPHHLVDVVNLSESFDAARFLDLAQAARREVESRGKVPVFCGGTGLYFNALAFGLGTTPPGNMELRAELERTPLNQLLAELAEKDRETFDRIDRKNARRVIRAVEVLRSSGGPLSSQRAIWPKISAGIWIGLEREREDLNQRINRRVEQMFARGLVEETRSLLERGLEQNRTAMQAIGYRQVVEHLRGERSLPETVALIQQKTRQYAKRQMTWFRRQLSLDWLPVEPGSGMDNLLKQVLQRISRPPQSAQSLDDPRN